MARVLRRILLVGLALALVACGAAGGYDDDGGDDDDTPDGGSYSDAQPSTDASTGPCSLTVTPSLAPAPADLIADFDYPSDPGEVHWSVFRSDGEPVAFKQIGPLSILAHVDLHGLYTVVADAPGCDEATADVELVASEQSAFRFRLGYLPPPGMPVARQEAIAPFLLQQNGELLPAGIPGTAYQLQPGVVFSGHLTQKGTTLGVGAALMLEPHGGGPAVRVFSDPATGNYDGGFVARGMYDLVIVPYDATVGAPFRSFEAEGSLVETLAGEFPLDPGELVTGKVLGPGPVAVPVEGARVSLAADGALPSIARTDADGKFQLYVRPGALRLEVFPPGHERSLVLAESAGVTATGGDLTVTLGALAPVEYTTIVKDADGAALPRARVTFVATPGGANGTVQQGEGALLPAAAGQVRIPAAADLTGQLAVTLPAASYQVVVEPPEGVTGQALAVTTLDLSSGSVPPAAPALATARAKPIKLKVVRKGANGELESVGGATITALARGQLGVAAGAAFSGKADDITGELPMAATPGMAYELVVEAPRSLQLARLRVVKQAAELPAPDGTLTLTMPASLVVQQTVRLPDGSPAGGVRVGVHCDACLDPGFLYDEAETDKNGFVTLAVPNLAALP